MMQDLQKPYNETTFLTAHNSFSNQWDGWEIYQQTQNLERQLQGGVRAFMIDIWYTWLFSPLKPYKVYLLHGGIGSFTTVFYPFYKYKTLEDYLLQLVEFLEKPGNENEIVTVFIETGDSAKKPDGRNAVKATLTQTRPTLGNKSIKDFIFDPTSAPDFTASLADIINGGKRLIVLSDYRAGAGKNSAGPVNLFGLPVVSHYATENVHGDESLNTSTWTNLRAESVDSISAKRSTLVILNHFPGLRKEQILYYNRWVRGFYPYTNRFQSLAAHVAQYRLEHNQTPNFIAVDMFEMGDDNGPQKIIEYCDKVRKLPIRTLQISGVNGLPMSVPGGISHRSVIVCRPENPGKVLTFELSGSMNNCLLSVVDSKGKRYYLSYRNSGEIQLYNSPDQASWNLEDIGNSSFKIESNYWSGQYISLYGNLPMLNTAGATRNSNYWTFTFDLLTAPQAETIEISTIDPRMIGPRYIYTPSKSLRSKLYCKPFMPGPILFEVLGPYDKCILRAARATPYHEAFFLSYSDSKWAELWHYPTFFNLILVPGTLDVYHVYFTEIDRYLRLSFKEGTSFLQVYASYEVGTIDLDELKWKITKVG